MTRILALLAALALAAPVAAQTTAPKPLTLEHRMLLRCSAAFAIVANRQAAGDAAALAWPPLKERGSEFFVRSSARVMDEAHLDRAALAEALAAEARSLAEGDALARIMPACLSALDGAGL
jgi:hypothetical protein